LGACIGEVIAGKTLGKKALLLGAIAQNIPDIDFVASFWLPGTKDLLAHRGFTHSFLFVLLASMGLAWLCRIIKTAEMTFRQWFFFLGIQIFIHVFIDSFNAYGTGWFEPFSHYRVSFNSLYVADPLFSIWPAIATIGLLILRQASNKRVAIAKMAIVLSALYLFLSICFKLFIDHKVEKDLQANNMAYKEYITTPTPLNDLLWYIMVKNDSGYLLGYRSVFDKSDRINYHYDNKNEALLDQVNNNQDAKDLLRFSQGYYTVEVVHDTLEFNVLRFGEILGWAQPHPRPAFYYHLQYPDENKLVVQRGRFNGWNEATFKAFVKRMAGN
jgi:inner membrane protein